MNETVDQTDSAFLDIAANMLAILLILTLFSLVTVKHHSQSASDPNAVVDPAVPFATPQRDLFPPFSNFYFVAAERIVPWDQEAVLDALEQNPGKLFATVPQGRYQWLPEPLVTRDIDTYRLNFFPDIQAMIAAYPPFDEAMAKVLLDSLKGAYITTRQAPVFIVYPSGMEVFADFYPRLREHRIRFRWFARVEGSPLYLGRHPAQFIDYGIYW